MWAYDVAFSDFHTWNFSLASYWEAQQYTTFHGSTPNFALLFLRRTLKALVFPIMIHNPQ